MTEEEIYITRCIELAKNGFSQVSPNPIVGAVIVHNGKIIGEGYHSKCGCAHAEVNAINSVKDRHLLKESTIYVSLEPCSHYGKTPPCADLIIENKIPKVVIGCIDPFSKVAGKGIEKLRSAGIEVKVGILEKECINIIKRFITFNTQHRPYIILKWAESADGFIDVKRTDGAPIILSSPLANMCVHKLRSEVDSIMVGTHTALLDNPSLNVRNWHGKNPTRIVIDRELKLPKHLHLFDGNIKTFVFTEKEKTSFPNIEYITIKFQLDIIPQILNVLHEQKVQSLLVEGGSVLLQSFINSDIWDEIRIEKTSVLLYNGVKAPEIKRKKNYTSTSLFGSHYIDYENKWS